MAELASQRRSFGQDFGEIALLVHINIELMSVIYIAPPPLRMLQTTSDWSARRFHVSFGPQNLRKISVDEITLPMHLP